MLLAVAPYSQYDLTFLDLLDGDLGSEAGVPEVVVYVANLRDYGTYDQLNADFPGVGKAVQTPLAAVWGPGWLKTVASGARARELVAEVLGLAASELHERVRAGAPSYSNPNGS